MRIGVMLRTIDEKQGIGIYTQNLMDHLLPLDRENEYVLFYRTPEFLGRYAHHEHVREKLVTAPNKLVWDQVKIPMEARRHDLDVIFNTKFTVPLLTGCKTVMVLHGSEWYVYPQSYQRLDIFYVRRMMPVYHRKANVVISVSNRAKDDMVKYAGADPDKFRTVYLAADDRFFEEPDKATLRRVKEKYGLPDRFILNVGPIYPGKNVKNVLRAYARIREHVPHKLVIAGPLRWKYDEELEPIEQYGLHEDVVFPGWVSQEDMPALYRLADVFVFPSWYEGFGIAMAEAMASGCPVVASGTGALPEVAGEAAIFVEPGDHESIADALLTVLKDEPLARRLKHGGLRKSKQFTWDRTAKQTLAVLQSLNGDNA